MIVVSYLSYVCYIVGSACFIVGRGQEKYGPWYFIVGSILGMTQL
jgi:hypothetical protein